MSGLLGALLAWGIGLGARPAPTSNPVPSILKLELRKLDALPAAPEPTDEGASERDAASEARRARELVSEGNALLQAGRLRGAKTSFRNALHLVPDYQRALSGMASVAIAQRRGQDAIRYARALVLQRPKVAANQRLLGDAYESAGNVAAARKSWAIAASLGDAQASQKLRAAPQCTN